MFRTIAISFALALSAAPISVAAAGDNALLQPWSGPYGGVPPLDRIRVEDFNPALQAAMVLHRREIAAITGNPEPPTFANTVLALERSGELLNRIRTMYDVWGGSLNSPGMRLLQRQMEPQLAAHDDALNQNAALFARVEAVYASAELSKLKPEQQRLVWSYRTEFIKQGARLDADAKERVAAINRRLTALSTAFGQNLLADEEKAGLVVAAEADLAGLAPFDVASFAQEADRRGMKGRWVVANTRSAMEPFLTRSARRDLRERAWKSWTSRGDGGDSHDNNRIVSETLALRAERAKLMGFPTYAHWKLSDSMAHEPQAAMDLMLKAWKPAVEQLRQQIVEAQGIADAQADEAKTPHFALQPWDLRFYLEKLRKAQYDFNDEQLTPYLQLDKVRDAMFWAAGRLYGLSFVPVQGVPVFHPDMTVYRVVGRDGRHVGLWYFDPYARDGKASGAWMGSYRLQQRMAGDIRPVVSNNSNFGRGQAGQPVLVSWDDAVVMFHEFGHAVHGLTSDATYPRLAGPNSVQDFGEVPSMVNQYWLASIPVLSRLVDTGGRPVPKALVDKLLRAKNFVKPFQWTEFLASALLDMRLHLVSGGVVPDPRAFEQLLLGELGMPPAIGARHRIPQFAHVFSGEGYAAGYYGYLWAEVLARDLYAAFLETGNPFDPGTAQRYLKTMLSVGNTVDPAEAFRQFRGRDPEVGALLRADGLAR